MRKLASGVLLESHLARPIVQDPFGKSVLEKKNEAERAGQTMTSKVDGLEQIQGFAKVKRYEKLE